MNESMVGKPRGAGRPTYEELVEVLDDMISMGAAYTHLMPDRGGHNRARVDKAEALLARCRQERST